MNKFVILVVKDGDQVHHFLVPVRSISSVIFRAEQEEAVVHFYTDEDRRVVSSNHESFYRHMTISNYGDVMRALCN